MKISDKTYILILVIMILGLSLITYRRFEKFRLVLPEAELQKIEMPEMELELQKTLFPEKEEKQEWISPDNKLKLIYSASWQEMDQALLQQAEGAEIILTESEILFFAYRFKVQEQAFALLVVSQGDAKKTLEEIIKEAKQNIEDKEGERGEIEITVLETEGETSLLEMVLKYADQADFYSKGKIIFAEEKNYLVFFVSPQKDWPQFQEKADEVLGSIRLLQ